MHLLITAFLNKLERLHRQAWEAIADLPPQALDWQPAPETNSINVLVTHLTGAQKYLLQEVVLGKPSEQEREAEFQARGLKHADLRALLEEGLQIARRLLASVSPQDLEHSHYSRRHGRDHTAAWGLLHILEHTALHVGHIQLTAQWWHNQHKQTALPDEK